MRGSVGEKVNTGVGIVSTSSYVHAFQLDRTIVVEEYIRNCGSPIITQRAFRVRSVLDWHDPIPNKEKIYNYRFRWRNCTYS